MPEPRRPLALRALGGVLFWSPVWAALGLAVQLAVLGLAPARAERARLSRETPRVVERHARSVAEVARLEAEAIAWLDPVFRARVRQSRGD